MNKKIILLVLSLFLSNLLIGEDAIFVESDMVHKTEIREAAEAYNNGTRLMHEGNYEEAEEQLRLAITRDAEFVDAYDHLGIVLRRTNRLEEAFEIYEKSYSLNEENLIPIINMALIYNQMQKPNEAIEMYQKAIDIDPENPEGYYGVGLTFYNYGYYNEAVPYMEIAAVKYEAADSNHIFDAFFVLGICKFELQEFKTSAIYLEAALQVYTGNEYIIKTLSLIYAQDIAQLFF